ncbi:MAG: PH domain-containing protein [Acidobacteria bacterium]|nr:PH domain-containing protein [Acidobacteriota bacterium]
MYCMNCSADVPQGARFCAACGAGVDPEATRVAAPTRGGGIAVADFNRPLSVRPTAEDDDTERVIFQVRPTFLFIGIGYGIAAVAAILLTVVLAYFDVLSPTISLLLALPLLLIPAYHHLRRNTINYTLTDSKIVIDQGLISHRTRNIPLRNIQDVTVSSSIFQRLLGFGDLRIENANEGGGHTLLDNIPDPRRHADLLLRELRRWR